MQRTTSNDYILKIVFINPFCVFWFPVLLKPKERELGPKLDMKILKNPIFVVGNGPPQDVVQKLTLWSENDSLNPPKKGYR